MDLRSQPTGHPARHQVGFTSRGVLLPLTTSLPVPTPGKLLMCLGRERGRFPTGLASLSIVSTGIVWGVLPENYGLGKADYSMILDKKVIYAAS